MDIIRELDPDRTACPHVPESLPEPSGERCEECGSTVSLRMCAACGHVGCCESQAGDARRHALGEGHPVILSMPIGRGFTWCYEERAYVG
ncbi:MAG TPA: UBP-type zinc finger domain-containing protein [Candidatus Sulfomarinibacteraceae bacterium]|nr:UBP-type zinc finger domain-containing protein [Candidatus Sulfomarinibacteraceae bacterium]